MEDKKSKKKILKIAGASCLTKNKCQPGCLTPIFEKVEDIG